MLLEGTPSSQTKGSLKEDCAAADHASTSEHQHHEMRKTRGGQTPMLNTRCRKINHYATADVKKVLFQYLNLLTLINRGDDVESQV